MKDSSRYTIIGIDQYNNRRQICVEDSRQSAQEIIDNQRVPPYITYKGYNSNFSPFHILRDCVDAVIEPFEDATTLHYDMFKREITIGAYAVSFHNNGLHLFVVDELNPIMVGLRISNGEWKRQRYPWDIIIVDNEMGLLKILSD